MSYQFRPSAGTAVPSPHLLGRCPGSRPIASRWPPPTFVLSAHLTNTPSKAFVDISPNEKAEGAALEWLFLLTFFNGNIFGWFKIQKQSKVNL